MSIVSWIILGLIAGFAEAEARQSGGPRLLARQLTSD